MRNWLIPISGLSVIFVGGLLAGYGLAPDRGRAPAGGPTADAATDPSAPEPPAHPPGEAAPTQEESSEAVTDAGIPEVGPNGRPIEPVPENREVRTEGLPPRPDAVPPADNPEVWASRREEQDAGWRRAVLTTTEAWATEAGLSAEERTATLGALENMHGALAQIREEMLEGQLARREGRDGMARIRREARESLVKTLGEPRVESLLAALSELPGGGF